MILKENVRWVKLIAKRFSLPLKIIKPEKLFLWYVFCKLIERGKRKGERGYGVPSCMRNERWCCKVLRRDPFYKWLHEEGIKEVELFTGYTVNEVKRVRRSWRGSWKGRELSEK